MSSADPTYPLYPISCTLAAAMLLLTLLTSIIRQSWNLGVALLCFWLCLENVTYAVNTVLWADNADARLYVYCGIVTRLQLLCYVIKPMSTLIITRRLYLIASLQSVDLPSASQRRRNSILEWTAGLLIPIIVAGPLYYVVQPYRFQITRGFGCANPAEGSVLAILLVDIWGIVPPLLSVLVYYPRVVGTFVSHGRAVNEFLRSNGSVSRTNYMRILALASVDVVLTLPMGITFLVLQIFSKDESLPFYRGWSTVHAHWDIVHHVDTIDSRAGSAQAYFSHWASPVLAFTIFALFGMTAEARASYAKFLRAVVGRCRRTSPRTSKDNGRFQSDSIVFASRPQEYSPDSDPII
ncbi:unnamed protein product [Peniophora sp. CBMAI 1063]|nr:unnamed protein product [Peniophora sp. CBMAI 1063]